MASRITESTFSAVNLLQTDKTAKDYSTIQPFLATVQAFSRVSYQSVYIFDYYKNNFLYLSDNPLFLCGKKVDYVKRIGFEFFVRHVPEPDLMLLSTVNQAGFEFFNKLSAADKLQYSISYNFHLMHGKHDRLLVNQKMTPLLVDAQNKIWLALGIVSMASEAVTGKVEIRKAGTDIIYELNPATGQWELKQDIRLTAREKEVLMLSAQGLTNMEISRKIYLTEATIKFHKSKIFKKLGVTNIAEAIGYITNYVKL